jgi:RES domain-containing protein
MLHDQDLLDRLSTLRFERIEAEVYRATPVNADPTAASTNGGRWSTPSDGDPGVAALYTAYEKDGAIAEVASYLAVLTPLPGPRLIKVTRLAITTTRTVRLSRSELEALEVDFSLYGARDYRRTQQIGAALAFLDIDGLIAPSARWSCDNLVVFADNHELHERLDPVASEQIEWREWAREHGLL